jgi:hypothetical protein
MLKQLPTTPSYRWTEDRLCGRNKYLMSIGLAQHMTTESAQLQSTKAMPQTLCLRRETRSDSFLRSSIIIINHTRKSLGRSESSRLLLLATIPPSDEESFALCFLSEWRVKSGKKCM